VIMDYAVPWDDFGKYDLCDLTHNLAVLRP
jgi:hypothetical protein